MKKHVSAICLAALLLTGCGSTATTAESSAPAAETSSAAKEESAPEKEESAPKADSAEESAEQEVEYYEWQGIEMPISAGWEMDSPAALKSYTLWTGGTESDPVYFGFDSLYSSADITRTDADALTKTADALYEKINRYISVYYRSRSDTSKKTVDSVEETTFLNYPVLREEGSITTEDNVKLNYVAYYFVLDYTDGGYPDLPSFWIAFTPSDDPEALNTMKKTADAPLTLAYLYQH